MLASLTFFLHSICTCPVYTVHHLWQFSHCTDLTPGCAVGLVDSCLASVTSRQLTDEPIRIPAGNRSKDKPRPLAPVHPYVERIIGQLLMMASSDIDGGVRRATIECLLSAFDPRKHYSLKPFFTHADSVAALTLCLNDVVPHVRLAALSIMGHISRLNSAAASPVLRRYLEQLLTDIEHCPDSHRLDDSTMLLAEMIHQVRLRSLALFGTGQGCKRCRSFCDPSC
jgi:hypothetical protein